jgi:flagella basal body P-ring formation protein FlgA
LETILQLLCRTFQTFPRPACGALALVAVLLGGVVSISQAQNAPAPSPALASAWPALEAGAKQLVVDSQKVDPALVTILPMDSRIKIQACSQNIEFDQPYGNKQSVRARCAQPLWQHFVMVQVRNTLGNQITQVNNNGNVNRPVWVSSQSLKRGTTLQAGMFKQIELPVPAYENRLVGDERDMLNMELLRDLPANTPLRLQDLKASTMVKRGQQVLVAVGEGKGFLITVRAEAQQDGTLGDQIRLKNPESGRFLSAVITGMNTARGL